MPVRRRLLNFQRAEAVIAWGTYLAGTNTRRSFAALFGGAIGKDTVSEIWTSSSREQLGRPWRPQ
jgi:hypothetical protein